MPSVSLRADLPGAALRGELIAYYQPQIDVASGRIVAAEALARWWHPQLGLVPPLDFIPIAEETGAIHEIGDFMIEQSCGFAASADAEGIEVAVNVSAVQLTDPGFSDRLTEAYLRHGLSPAHLTVELTESQPVLNVPDAIAQLEKLRSLGIGVSIDDFGSGHSSLRQLQTLPFSELKIDQSLIRDTAPIPAYVCEAVDTAHELGLRVVAEGIETEHHFARAVELQCDRAQGYLFSRPTTENHLRRLLGVEL